MACKAYHMDTLRHICMFIAEKISLTNWVWLTKPGKISYRQALQIKQGLNVFILNYLQNTVRKDINFLTQNTAS